MAMEDIDPKPKTCPHKSKNNRKIINCANAIGFPIIEVTLYQSILILSSSLDFFRLRCFPELRKCKAISLDVTNKDFPRIKLLQKKERQYRKHKHVTTCKKGRSDSSYLSVIIPNLTRSSMVDI